MPYGASLQYHVISYPIISIWYHSVSIRIKSYHTIVSNNFMQYHITPCGIILCVYLYVWRQTPPQSKALIVQWSLGLPYQGSVVHMSEISFCRSLQGPRHTSSTQATDGCSTSSSDFPVAFSQDHLQVCIGALKMTARHKCENYVLPLHAEIQVRTSKFASSGLYGQNR